MWLLRNINNAECFYLTNKSKYAVGKINADLIIRDDSSISRSHAEFYVSRADDGTAILHLKDVGSKYGVFLDEGITSNTCVEKKKLIQLKDGTRVRFGVIRSVWDVRHYPLESVTSTLPLGESQFLEECLNSLGGKLLTSWKSSCSHLTMSELQVTVKLLYALMEQKPVVTVQYWRDLKEAVKNQSKELPNPRKYAPPCSDFTLKNQVIDLGSRTERKTLFTDTIFLFMNRRQSEIYEPLITKTGGISKNLNKGIAKSVLLKRNVVVIQYVPSTESQCSQTVSSIEDYLQSHGRRIIPEYEIGLAIVLCSNVKYCNPDYKLVSDLIPSSPNMEQPSAGGLLAPNTHINTCSNSAQDDVNIAETEVNPNIPPRPTVQQEIAVINSKNDSNDIEVLQVLRKNSSPVKRKHSIEDQDDDENLFAFSEKSETSSLTVEKSSKRICTETSRTEHLTENANNSNKKNVSTAGFLNKSCIPKTQEVEPATTIEQPTRSKRTHIAVLTDDDDDDDNDLFNFNDDGVKRSPNKRPRLNQSTRSVHIDLDEGELFNFTQNRTQPNSVSKVVPPKTGIERENGKKTTVPKTPLPQPKELPRHINTGNWLNSSMHKMHIKDELDDGENVKIKLEDKGLDSSVDQVWLETIKKGLTMRTTNVSTIRSKVSFHNDLNSTPSSNSSIESGKKNFKKFVKVYQRPGSFVNC